MARHSTPPAPAPSDALYAQGVLDALGDHFDLGETVRDIIRQAVLRQRTAPSTSFEVIVDNPHSASWRLRPHRDDPSRVRLGDYRLPPRQGGQRPCDPRQVAVNKALDRLA